MDFDATLLEATDSLNSEPNMAAFKKIGREYGSVSSP